ncbi:MAG TPA: hypothetical protein ENI34_07160 [candidate division WOR-3 bacterium]|uniref:Uncharacterized protein n=1 Tax=candidate division WOR-3 bacterium TaxID=2052148 RepID=A0A9C9EMW5_UNCW3|nr:hypothetical protein [candidate division WOR-3 bacterium]
MGKVLGKVLVLIIIISLIIPYQSFAGGTKTKGNVAQEAKRKAISDAKRDVNRLMWLGCGCIGTIYAVGAAYLIVPGPKAERLLGKSPDYVYIYTNEYKSARRGQQARYALIGCITGGVIVLTAVAISASQDEVECCTGPDLSCGLSEDCNSMSESCNSCSNTSEGCSDNSEGCSSSGCSDSNSSSCSSNN